MNSLSFGQLKSFLKILIGVQYELAGETELANKFSHIQAAFLNALRQEPGTTIVLGEYLPMADLESAVDEYIVLIERNK